MPDQDYELFVRKVKAHTGIDLAQYKEAQMKRRLTTLRLKRGYSTFVSYFQALVQDRELMREFLDRMTINVSEFWRNPNRWEMLEQRFIPELARERGFRLKCWSAACSTGEEPYTLAMILAEHKLLAHARIIASDIDEGALAKAKEGVYPDRSVKDVPPRYLKTYFVQDSAQQYRVVPELKQAVRWEKKNLLLDPFDHLPQRGHLFYGGSEARAVSAVCRRAASRRPAVCRQHGTNFPPAAVRIAAGGDVFLPKNGRSVRLVNKRCQKFLY